MKMRKHRESRTLNPWVGRRLFAYATMAGAVAVGCAPHANAEVVYTSVHSFINQHFNIDLNHDGINDFFLSSYDFSGVGAVKAHALGKHNRIATTHLSCLGKAAAAFAKGAVIGPAASFQRDGSCMADMFSYVFYNGAWLVTKNQYLGVAFSIDGKIHYGWVRVHVSHDFNFCGCIGAIDGYAYETIPGKPIVAGDTGQSEEASLEPGSLGMLALGAPGMQLWRREPGQG